MRIAKGGQRIVASALAASMLCSLGACAAAQGPEVNAPAVQSGEATATDEETLKTYAEASTGKEILARHKNYVKKRSVYRDDKEVFGIRCHTGSDIYVQDDSDGSTVLFNPERQVGISKNNAGGQYITSFFEPASEATDSLERQRDIENIVLDEREKPVEMADANDGNLVITTEVKDAELVKDYLDYASSYGGYGYEDGATLTWRYTFDKDSKDLLSIEATLVDPKGTSHAFIEETYEYDVEDYDPAKEGEPFADYFAALEDETKARTLNVTFDPDGEEEHVVSYTVPLGTYANIIYNGEPVSTFYSDRECTKTVDFGGKPVVDSVEEDMLYVKKQDVLPQPSLGAVQKG